MQNKQGAHTSSKSQIESDSVNTGDGFMNQQNFKTVVEMEPLPHTWVMWDSVIISTLEKQQS